MEDHEIEHFYHEEDAEHEGHDEGDNWTTCPVNKVYAQMSFVCLFIRSFAQPGSANPDGHPKKCAGLCPTHFFDGVVVPRELPPVRATLVRPLTLDSTSDSTSDSTLDSTLASALHSTLDSSLD